MSMGPRWIDRLRAESANNANAAAWVAVVDACDDFTAHMRQRVTTMPGWRQDLYAEDVCFYVRALEAALEKVKPVPDTARHLERAREGGRHE